MGSTARVLALAPLALMLCSCVGGSTFVEPDKVPSDKALVYFYRPPEFQGGALTLDVLENGAPVVSVQNGQFVPAKVEPGTHKYYTKTMAIDKATQFETSAGETYYVRIALRHGMWVNTLYLSRVYPDEALLELRACCKSGADEMQPASEQLGHPASQDHPEADMNGK